MMTSTFNLPPLTMTSRDDTLRDAGNGKGGGRGTGQKGWTGEMAAT